MLSDEFGFEKIFENHDSSFELIPIFNEQETMLKKGFEDPKNSMAKLINVGMMKRMVSNMRTKDLNGIKVLTEQPLNGFPYA